MLTKKLGRKIYVDQKNEGKYTCHCHGIENNNNNDSGIIMGGR
jgi:hypothetical protein